MVNDNENDDWPDTSGRSVFGDAPNSEELPVVSMDNESSVFGDEPESEGASVLGDSDEGEQLAWDSSADDGDTAATSGGANSVFGDSADDGDSVFGDSADDGDSVFGDASSTSLDDDPWAADADAGAAGVAAGAAGVAGLASGGFDNDDVEITDGHDEVVIEREISLEEPATPDVPEVSDVPESSVPVGSIDDDLVVESPVDDVEIDTQAPAAVTIDNWSTPDEAPTPEAVALDVEPGGDDLDAWSDLGGPAWGEESEAAAEPQAWDPAFDDEPAVVTVGDAGDQFFGYDDPSQGDGFDDGFVVDEVPGANMQARIITGVALLVVGFVGLALGPTIALALIVLIVALCAGEFYNALRVAGYQPATLLGLAATITMPIAVFVRGPQAVALILALSVVFGLLWFLLGVGSEIPTMNIGVTLLGIVYIGVLGSFGAAMLEIASRAGLNGDDGTGLLLAAIIITVGYDVGAFFAGRSIGRTPLTAVSPNKTVEGLVGGAVTSAVAVIVVFGLVRFGEPWGTADVGFLSVVALGVVGAIVAPLGDLGESLLKRDLGIKDMGSVLPGHGGFLDRFDALLFVLPAVYFFAEVVFY